MGLGTNASIEAEKALLQTYTSALLELSQQSLPDQLDFIRYHIMPYLSEQVRSSPASFQQAQPLPETEDSQTVTDNNRLHAFIYNRTTDEIIDAIKPLAQALIQNYPDSVVLPTELENAIKLIEGDDRLSNKVEKLRIILDDSAKHIEPSQTQTPESQNQPAAAAAVAAAPPAKAARKANDPLSVTHCGVWSQARSEQNHPTLPRTPSTQSTQ